MRGGLEGKAKVISCARDVGGIEAVDGAGEGRERALGTDARRRRRGLVGVLVDSGGGGWPLLVLRGGGGARAGCVGCVEVQAGHGRLAARAVVAVVVGGGLGLGSCDAGAGAPGL